MPFPCPHCGQTIVDTPELAGMTVACPACTRHFQTPAVPVPQSASPFTTKWTIIVVAATSTLAVILSIVGTGCYIVNQMSAIPMQSVSESTENFTQKLKMRQEELSSGTNFRDVAYERYEAFGSRSQVKEWVDEFHPECYRGAGGGAGKAADMTEYVRRMDEKMQKAAFPDGDRKFNEPKKRN